jgi:hypothetical protein
MKNLVFVGEGSHDVSFLGKLLANRGFSKITEFDQVPNEWKNLYPKKFPWNQNAIERVARFPELFTSKDIVVGLLNSGGDSKLISSLRNALNALGPGYVDLVAIFSDADVHPAITRFKSLQGELNALNTEALAEGEPGFPIYVPETITVIKGSKPAIGIFVFPDNASCGSIEKILFACAEQTHPELAEKAYGLVSSLDLDMCNPHSSLKELRKGLGKEKATMGIIANILKPGMSLAVSVEQQKMIPDIATAPALVQNLDSFLEAMLKR